MRDDNRRCAKCALDLPAVRFDCRPNGRWSAYCKTCLSLYCRHHYVKNSKLHNARRMEAQKRYVIRNRDFVSEYLSTHPCVDCGENERLLLEFDHIEPDNKKFEVSFIVRRGRSLKELQLEISRCVVRCAHCHRRRTARQFGWSKGISLLPGCSSAW